MRNRVIELIHVRAGDVLDNPNNWRRHDAAQFAAIRAVLEEVGIAGVLLAYKSERANGALVLVDGHGRKADSPDEMWPTVVLDLSDEEADKILATFDPISGMAETDTDALRLLVESIQTDSLSLRDLLWRTVSDGPKEREGDGGEKGAPPMSVQPFEQYDYVFVVYKDPVQFQEATALLGLEARAYPQPPGSKQAPKLGLCRVVDGASLNERLSRAPAAKTGAAAGTAVAIEDDGDGDAMSRLAQ